MVVVISTAEIVSIVAVPITVKVADWQAVVKSREYILSPEMGGKDTGRGTVIVFLAAVIASGN
jgi:hypothetical protein